MDLEFGEYPEHREKDGKMDVRYPRALESSSLAWETRDHMPPDWMRTATGGRFLPTTMNVR